MSNCENDRFDGRYAPGTIPPIMLSRYKPSITIALISLVIIIAYIGIVISLRSLAGQRYGYILRQTIAWYFLAFGAYIGALVWVEKRGRLSAKWIWITAVFLRLVFLLTTPKLSDDIYRYLWDGNLAKHGVSPYQYPINAPELDYLQIPAREMANHTGMASPYLPAVQFLFAGLAYLFPLKPIFFQLCMLVIDLLCGWVLVKLLALASLPRHRAIIYLWNPLVIVEVAHSAHVESWMVLLTLTAVYFTLKKPQNSIKNHGNYLAPTSMALATLTKFIPVLILPIIFWRWSWRQRFLYVIVTISLLLPSALRAGWGLTGALDGTGLFGAIRIYYAQWNFNSGLFHWLERWLGAPGFGTPSLLAKLIALSILAVVMLVMLILTRKPSTPKNLLQKIAVPFMAYLLLTPTAHPWYAMILIAFLPFLSPDKLEPQWKWWKLIPWLYLSGALTLSYLTYFDPLNPGELEWVRKVEWLPTLLSLAIFNILLLKNMIRRRLFRGQDTPSIS